jgi:FtsZ-interacting cell division protein ZipA
MSGLAVVVAVVVGVVVIALVVVGFAQRRHRRAGLRDQFGSEYDRTVGESDSRRKGERELQDRTERREQLEIVPLSASESERYRAEWRMVQERFVDAPAESVAMAHALLAAAMSDRGYPTGDHDERASLLSVDNADVVEQYRQGIATEERWRNQGAVDTEDLRQAMQHYRVVFGRVVGTVGSSEGDGPNDGSPTARVGDRA